MRSIVKVLVKDDEGQKATPLSGGGKTGRWKAVRARPDGARPFRRVDCIT